MNKWREFAEWLGVEYEVPFKAKGVKKMLVITDEGVSYVNDNGTYDKDNVLPLHLIDGRIELDKLGGDKL